MSSGRIGDGKSETALLLSTLTGLSSPPHRCHPIHLAMSAPDLSGIDLNRIPCGPITCQELVDDLWAIYYTKLVNSKHSATLIRQGTDRFARSCRIRSPYL